MKLNYINLLFIVALALFSCQTNKEPVDTSEKRKPNIVLIMADDMGFSDIGSYGGEVHTPNIDALAKGGLRYTQFYNNARCCPTRASLMTGVYPHQAGMGWMTTADMGTPAYQGELNLNTVTIAEVLKLANYDTYMTGKWHLSRVRNIKAEIKDNWPKQRGFDEFFGIVDGGANYFTPEVYSDNKKYKARADDFYLTHAISDSTIMFMDKHFSKDKQNPMFMYVAYTAPHWPLHALEEDIAKYKEVYQIGWDKLRAQRLEKQKKLKIFDVSAKLSPRDSKVPAWDELSKAEQDEFAKRMAIYAAQIDAMDQGIGRIVNKLKELDEFDHTIILFLSDNGACAEYISGGPSKELTGSSNTWESYRKPWANAGSTPYKEYKHWIHEGGIASPFIVHWPKGIDDNLKGALIKEPGHIMDVMATALEVADIHYPEKYHGNMITPLEGKSLVPHFSGQNTNREPIFWEHEANIGMRDGHWKLVAKTDVNKEFNVADLELYNMEKDPVELHNLADQQPERLNRMYKDWQQWADKVGVVFDTRDYGQRTRAYQRTINGEFENAFAGWRFIGKESAEFSIDTTTQLSGKTSAKVAVQKAGSIAMFWPIYARQRERFDFSFKTKASKNTMLKVVFESVNGDHIVQEQEINVGHEIKRINFNTGIVNTDKQYRLAFYLKNTEPGTRIWLDHVQLTTY